MVNKASSTTAVSSSANPSVFGQAVTFSATVTAVAPGAGTPTGTVQFKTNGVNFGSAVALSGGSASSSAAISSLAVGNYTVTADLQRRQRLQHQHRHALRRPDGQQGQQLRRR